jgi:hypothetical protein
LRIKPNRLCQVAFRLLDHEGHLFQTGSGRQRTHARGVILLFEQGEDAIAAFINVKLWIALGEIDHAIEEVDVVQLRSEQKPIDAVVPAPIGGGHCPHFS